MPAAISRSSARGFFLSSGKVCAMLSPRALAVFRKLRRILHRKAAYPSDPSHCPAALDIHGGSRRSGPARRFVRDGAGDDRYQAPALAQGSATANGIGILSDGGGADRWQMSADLQSWGRSEWLSGLPS